MLLIILSASMVGSHFAKRLIERVSALECALRLYRYLHDRLKFLQPGVISLIDAAVQSGEFEKLSFLRECRENMKDSGDFADSWKKALENNTSSLGREASAVMASLSGVLGKTDLESQLAAIDYGAALLEKRLENAREYAKKHQRLYRTLGVLAGALVVALIA